MLATTRVGLGGNREPRTQSGSPKWVVGNQILEPALLPYCSRKARMKSKARAELSHSDRIRGPPKG